MPRIKADDYYGELELLSPDQAIGKSIHTIGNRLNTISAATDLLRIHLDDRENLPPQETLDRLLELITTNTVDLAETLNALGKYNLTLREK